MSCSAAEGCGVFCEWFVVGFNWVLEQLVWKYMFLCMSWKIALKGWGKSITLKWTWTESLIEHNRCELNLLSSPSLCCSGGLAAESVDHRLRGPCDRGDPAVWDRTAGGQPDHLPHQGKEAGRVCLRLSLSDSEMNVPVGLMKTVVIMSSLGGGGTFKSRTIKIFW